MNPGSIIDDAMAAKLIRTFESKRWRGRAPLKSWGCWHDRLLVRIFHGAATIGAEEALIRSLAISPYVFDAAWAGETLKWGFRHGILEPSNRAGEPTWTLLRHGVTFVPLGGDAIDVRTAGECVGRRSARAAIAQEAYRRAKSYSDDLVETNGLIMNILRGIDPGTMLPDDLRSIDLPPVVTVGEMLDEFASFGRDLSLHRARQVRLQLIDLSRGNEKRIGLGAAPAAPELDDFTI
nr:hypothetical protein [uncultured Devosia sp.]